MLGGKKQAVHFPPINREMRYFQAISPLATSTNNREPDILELVAGLPPSSQVLFIELKRSFNYETNVVKLPLIKSYKSKEYHLLIKQIAPIKKAKLLKRITKPVERLMGLPVNSHYHFLLNPSLIKCVNQQEARTYWKALK